MKQKQKVHTLSAEPIERRSQTRDNQPHAAEVLIQQSGRNVTFPAVLVNTSSSGMCIRHWHKELAIGQIAQVSSPAYPEASAKVVWNWAVGPVVISGLQKLEVHSHNHDPRSARTLRISDHKSYGSRATTARTKLRSCLVGLVAGTILIAGWHFRIALWHLWSFS